MKIVENESKALTVEDLTPGQKFQTVSSRHPKGLWMLTNGRLRKTYQSFPAVNLATGKEDGFRKHWEVELVDIEEVEASTTLGDLEPTDCFRHERAGLYMVTDSDLRNHINKNSIPVVNLETGRENGFPPNLDVEKVRDISLHVTG